jgi:translation initiation factor 4A
MNTGGKVAAISKFKGSNVTIGRLPIARVLVVCDVQIKSPDVHQVPLVINYG